MTRQRLRPAHSPETLEAIYAEPHDHRLFEDHNLRVQATIGLGNWFTRQQVPIAADLSCGNGAILDGIAATTKIYGDYAGGYHLRGPIEQTIERLPLVDLFVCCESLEHLDDPDAVLRQIRKHTRGLLLSTPVDAWGDTNREHYWAWSRVDVEAMLRAAGFEPYVYSEVDFRPAGMVYSFGIWGAL